METRKILLMVVVVLFSISSGVVGKAWAKQRPQKCEVTDERIVLEYAFDKPTVTEIEGYDLLEIGGLKLHRRTGAPIVPVRPVVVSLPYGKKAVGTRAIVVKSADLPGTYRLPPGQKPYPLSYKGAVEETKPDPAIYGKAKAWPGKDCKTIGVQSKRGYQLFIVNLFPLQYTPVTGKVSYAKKMRLEIDLDVSERKPVLRRMRGLESSLKRAVDNPVTIDSYRNVVAAESALSGISGEDELMEAGGEVGGGGMSMMSVGGGEGSSPLEDPNCPYYGANYKYVVITNEDLSDPCVVDPNYNFETLCDSKDELGIAAGVVTTEWIYDNYNPNDYDPNRYHYEDPDDEADSEHSISIRMFLIDAYQTWGTEYALLGGNKDIVPPRMFWVRAYSGGPTDTMPVDMYYGCVEPNECTFDYDKDGKYGEPTDGVGGGDVDLYAEIYVGRAAVEDVNEVANFVEKSLTYVPSASDLPYVSMLGEYLGFGGPAQYAKPAKEQIRLGGSYDGYFTYGFENHPRSEYLDFITEGCLPAEPNDCWPLYDADETWPKQDLLDLMNGGVEIFNHLGHANYIYDMKLYTSDLSSLTNTDYFFAYSQGCMPGGFDEPEGDECFAEVITEMEHGAFAVIMNARSGWGKYYSTDGPSQRFDRQFWDAVLVEDMLEMGRANQDSKEDNLWDINGGCIRWCYYELNLFGDPEQWILELPYVYNETQDEWYWGIQDAIDEASNGDTIIAYPHTYNESINFEGKAITVRSGDPSNWDVVAATVINRVSFMSSESRSSVLKGFTITGASRGVYCYWSASPTIKNNIIRDNSNGIYMYPSVTSDTARPLIENNKIYGNSYGIYGNNYRSTSSHMRPNIKNNWIYDNTYGVKIYKGQATVRNCTIFGNTSKGIYHSSDGSTTVKNCIVWDNGDDLAGCNATYSCISDPCDASGTGNITTDPNFVDAANDDYHLNQVSPCINAGSGSYGGETDIDGDPRVMGDYVDMGGDEFWAVTNIDKGIRYPYIQEAINGADDGDVIEAIAGRYCEAIDFLGKAVLVRSTDPNEWDVVEATIIDANGLDDTVTFNSDEESNSVLKGFTISGGDDYGIYCSSTEPVISNCIIEDNSRGIYCGGSTSPVIKNNKIWGNDDIGVYISGTMVSMAPTIKNNWICDNGSYGIYLFRTSATVWNNTIANNTSKGIYRYAPYGQPSIKNCIIWGNGDDLDNCSATWSCIEDNDSGQGNIHDDPCFDAESGDYHILPESPCVNKGDPCYVPEEDERDIDGETRVIALRVDMGADETGRVHNTTKDKWYWWVQDAIDEASSGDVIVACEYTYYETIDFKGKAITVRSTDPKDPCVVADTIIDACDLGNTVTFDSDESSNSVLRGFTITGGDDYGIYCSSTSPTIDKCIIDDNNSRGIYCGGTASPVIKNNKIRKNANTGVYISGTMTSMAPTIINNWICDNGSSGIYLFRTSATVLNNTIAYNTSTGIYRYAPYGQPSITNCIVWGNGDDLDNCSATWSCIEDNDGGQGNIHTDPNFVDAANGVYCLRHGSGCIDAANGYVDPPTDIFGQARVDDPNTPNTGIGNPRYVDIGACEYNPD